MSTLPPELSDWVKTIEQEFSLDAAVDIEHLLELASVVAHQVVRPAAPVTTFYAGLLAGLRGGTSLDIDDSIRTLLLLCEAGADPQT